MYHTIEFYAKFLVDLETPSRHRLEQFLIRRGTRLRAEVKPYAMETAEGPVEVADLFFENGMTARMVPFEAFSFGNPRPKQAHFLVENGPTPWGQKYGETRLGSVPASSSGDLRTILTI